VFICGDIITINHDATDDELEQKRVALQKSLMEITERADSYFVGGKRIKVRG